MSQDAKITQLMNEIRDYAHGPVNVRSVTVGLMNSRSARNFVANLKCIWRNEVAYFDSQPRETAVDALEDLKARIMVEIQKTEVTA